MIKGQTFALRLLTNCVLLGITCTRTSAYHPHGNGQVERMNWTLKDMLAKTVEENQRN